MAQQQKGRYLAEAVYLSCKQDARSPNRKPFCAKKRCILMLQLHQFIVELQIAVESNGPQVGSRVKRKKENQKDSASLLRFNLLFTFLGVIGTICKVEQWSCRRVVLGDGGTLVSNTSSTWKSQKTGNCMPKTPQTPPKCWKYTTVNFRLGKVVQTEMTSLEMTDRVMERIHHPFWELTPC